VLAGLEFCIVHDQEQHVIEVEHQQRLFEGLHELLLYSELSFDNTPTTLVVLSNLNLRPIRFENLFSARRSDARILGKHGNVQVEVRIGKRREMLNILIRCDQKYAFLGVAEHIADLWSDALLVKTNHNESEDWAVTWPIH